MKKLKNLILLFLLFSFGFLVMHDFAIPESDFNIEKSLKIVESGEKSSMLKVEKVSDNIHKTIHTLVAVRNERLVYIAAPLVQQKSSSTRQCCSSNNHHVLERPPLS
ncbi:MAG: hypothetical protein JXQ67_03975 [Campylobacterales bacterium]|nr:hypothetical protein [Campylobacterales bacterium]